MKAIKVMHFVCGAVFSAAIGVMLAAVLVLAATLMLGASGGELYGGTILMGFVLAGLACTVDMLVDALEDDLK